MHNVDGETTESPVVGALVMQRIRTVDRLNGLVPCSNFKIFKYESLPLAAFFAEFVLLHYFVKMMIFAADNDSINYSVLQQLR